jgi:hypothetical protein
MEKQPYHNSPSQSVNVVLINAYDNPVATMDEPTFNENWHWHKAPRTWKPGEPLPTDEASVDALIVFAARYREEETRRLCEDIRQVPEWKPIPLLVAIDQYQMTLANRVREMPNADFVVTPIEEATLTENLNRAIASQE